MRTALIASFVIIVAGAALAQDYEQNRKSLANIEKFKVSVSITQDAGMNLSESEVITDTELKLRLAGIKVFDVEIDAINWDQFYGDGAILEVTITALNTDPTCVYSTDVRVLQLTTLYRDPSSLHVAQTWSAGITGSVGIHKLDRIRESTKDLVDEFLNAYLSVNPK